MQVGETQHPAPKTATILLLDKRDTNPDRRKSDRDRQHKFRCLIETLSDWYLGPATRPLLFTRNNNRTLTPSKP
jgi:hypothetical protein